VQKRISLYWLFQIGGWASYVLLFIVINPSVFETPSNILNPLFEAAEGLLISHLMRILILRKQILNAQLSKQIAFILILSFLFSFLYTITNILVEIIFNIRKPKAEPFIAILIQTWIANFIFLFIWNLIYFGYNYVTKSGQEKLDKARLENIVKELELKTIKAHVNPHFIFNALNSIRALIEENPSRARKAVTELSNLLRSSMRADKTEATPLGNEISIIKDYLALELIRFESRLNIEYNIDKNTLDVLVPPMMLQTLVENAIKHGISRQIEGGIVKISAHLLENNLLNLSVENTGRLNNTYKRDGFCIASTKNRLHFLYGDKAKFEIKGYQNNKVVAGVEMPAVYS
jgi:sensor histidine kinase YesM